MRVQLATPQLAVDPPAPTHDCRGYLPHLATQKHGRPVPGQTYPRDTVALCPVCAKAWRVVTGAQHGHKTWTWLPVRAWNTKARNVMAGLLLDLLETAP